MGKKTQRNTTSGGEKSAARGYLVANPIVWWITVVGQAVVGLVAILGFANDHPRQAATVLLALGIIGLLALVVLAALALSKIEVKLRGTLVTTLVLVPLALFAVGGWLIKEPPPPPPPPSPVFDFEQDTQGWGEHPENKVHVRDQGVKVYRNLQSPINHAGSSSLEFTPMEISNSNAYVSVRRKVEANPITAWVFVPGSAEDSYTSGGYSTAKIIVWDKEWASHESDYVELIPGEWQEISFDLRDKQWPQPWPEFGIHFYLASTYEGPFYVDDVGLENSRK